MISARLTCHPPPLRGATRRRRAVGVSPVPRVAALPKVVVCAGDPANDAQPAGAQTSPPRHRRPAPVAKSRPVTGLVIRNTVGEPVDPDTYSARFRSLCRADGPPVFKSIHNVRHTLATASKAADVPDHEAAALLGHDVETLRWFYLVAGDAGAAAGASVAGRLFAM